MIKFFIFGVLGILASVAFTAAKSSIISRRLDLTGHASLLLFPAYGLIAFLYPPIAVNIGGLPWYGRGAIYMAAFFVMQYFIGMGLKKINACPWSYSGGASLGGLVRLADAPLWFAAGLAIEWIYPLVKTAAS